MRLAAGRGPRAVRRPDRHGAFTAVPRLGSAGVGFVLITATFDDSTPAGQLMLTMLVGMAHFHSGFLGYETKN